MSNLAHALRDRLSTSTASSFPVKLTTLPRTFFRFPPSPEPRVLPAPDAHPLREYLFHIPPDVYNNLLSPNVPITIALVYATIVTYLNSVNKNRKYKPWAISRTRIFKLFVILHNTFLAVYSAWTFVGMVSAVRASMPTFSEHGIEGAVDALCKINGPRGLGSAATYNETSRVWAFTNRALHFGADGLTPDVTDVGRIWNEGLAFYGWLFYLSKFYEVIDTAIILAKGKKSSFLQTYHHAGAMLCMWAGIRYMSPPIWMFVLVNSFIHSIMYTFYLCSVIGIKVPKGIKQTLTTMQITQFVVGVIYAFAHLFIAYKAPVSVPYLYHFENVVSSVASSLPSHVSAAASTATASATAGVSAWLKRAAFRAAGREGLARNVLNEQGRAFGIDTTNAVKNFVARTETRYQDELHWTPCIDTSGQVFAIYLNCFYLAPLTGLFVRFFYKAYLKQMERRRSSTSSEKMQMARRSLSDASKGVKRQIEDFLDETRATNEEIGDDVVIVDDELKQELQDTKAAAQQKIREGIERTKEELAEFDTEKAKKNLSEGVQQTKHTVIDGVQKVQENVPQAARDAGAKISETTQQAQQSISKGAKEAAAKTSEGVEKVKQNVPKPDTERLKQEVANDLQKLKESLSQNKSPSSPSSPSSSTKQSTQQKSTTPNTTSDAKKQASDAAEAATSKAKDLAGEASQKVADASSKLSDTVNKSTSSDVKKQASDTAEAAKAKASEAAGEASKKAGEVSSRISETTNQLTSSLSSSTTTKTESSSKLQSKSQSESKSEHRPPPPKLGPKSEVKSQDKSEPKSSPSPSPRKAADHNQPGTTKSSATVSSTKKEVSDDIDVFSREARELLREQEEEKTRSAQSSPQKPSKLPQRSQSPTKKTSTPQPQSQEKKKSPNGAGTGAGEATGQHQLNLPTSEEEMKKMKDFKESQDDKKEKKTEEKILQQSKPVRDKDVK